MAFVRIPGNEVPNGAEEHWLEGRGGISFRVLTAPAFAGRPRGSVILCPGRTEFIEKYFEVIAELQHRGFNVMCIDWRGQGLSSRELGNAQKGHFNSFEDPVTDLFTAVKSLEAYLPRPYICLAHSMGGAIALRTMQYRRVDFDGAVFCAPMWAIKHLGGFAKKYARFVTALGAGGTYAPGVTHRWKREGYRNNPVTNDEERHARTQALVEADRNLALAGPTIGWVSAALDATDEFLFPNALSHLRFPIVVISASADAFVDNRRHDQIVALLPNAKHVTIQGAKHEIMMETDERRAQFWAAFDEVADAAAPPPG